MNYSENLKELFNRYYDGQASEEEKAQLMQLLKKAEHDSELPLLIKEAWEKLNIVEPVFSSDETAKILNRILKKDVPAKVVRFQWRKIAVAASILLAIGLGSYLLFFDKKKQNEIVKSDNFLPHDVAAPQTNRATITLANGQKIFLDSAANGTLAMEGNVQLVKLEDGKIEYKSEAGSQKPEVVYNTTTNPRGSNVVHITLSDGSHVWLNAGSSITYPVAFAGNERKVSMTGEAYFEISHDATKPFIVNKGETSVQVLGTHFNVNAYEDEENIKVTLLEGSVKVSNKEQSVVIKPGQQARIYPNTTPLGVGSADLKQVMAWKNGKFYFDETDMQTIMRQVARWYDVEIVYDGSIPAGHYNGKPSRDLSLAEMLKIVQYSGVKIKIEGKKVVVKP